MTKEDHLSLRVKKGNKEKRILEDVSFALQV